MTMQEVLQKHGNFSWNELMTTDLDMAKSFYGDLFGWQMEDTSIPEGIYTIVKAGDRQVGGMMSMPAAAAGAPPAWGSYVSVDDVDEQLSRVESLGGKVIMPAHDIPEVGRFAVISDPQGAMLTLITYNENYMG